MAKSKPQAAKEVILSVPMLSLLQRAQERFLEQRESLELDQIDPAPPARQALNTEALIHELQVHQIELEMQNEELLSAQAALTESREDYFDLYDLAPVGYLTLTDKGLIHKVNLTAASMLGCTRSALIKKPLTRFIHKSDQDRFYLCQKALLEAPNLQSCELRMRKASDIYFCGHAVLTLSKDRRGIAEQRIILTDITLRKQADDERTLLLELLQRRNTELEAAKIAVDQANRTQSTFISSVTHELRTPLNAILGFSQLLDSGLPAPTSSQKHRIDQISKAGWELLEMVDKIIATANGGHKNEPSSPN
jgi:PAS domain S-box-containing protein